MILFILSAVTLLAAVYGANNTLKTSHEITIQDLGRHYDADRSLRF